MIHIPFPARLLFSLRGCVFFMSESGIPSLCMPWESCTLGVVPGSRRDAAAEQALGNVSNDSYLLHMFDFTLGWFISVHMFGYYSCSDHLIRCWDSYLVVMHSVPIDRGNGSFEDTPIRTQRWKSQWRGPHAQLQALHRQSLTWVSLLFEYWFVLTFGQLGRPFGLSQCLGRT